MAHNNSIFSVSKCLAELENLLITKPINFDPDALMKDNFDPKTFVSSLLGNNVQKREYQTEPLEEILQELMDMLEESKDGEKLKTLFKLFQHPTGSGKGNTIAWLAISLAQIHTGTSKIWDKVIVYADRIDLVDQTMSRIEALCLAGDISLNLYTPKSAADLRDGLQATTPLIILTSLQKLTEVGPLNLLSNQHIALIGDEVHRSHGNETMIAINQMLHRNDYLPDVGAAFFGFSATPNPRAVSIFGKPSGMNMMVPSYYMSIQDAIARNYIMNPLSVYRKVELNTQAKLLPSERLEVLTKFCVSTLKKTIAKRWKAFPGKAIIVVSGRSEVVSLTKSINSSISENEFRASAIFSEFWNSSGKHDEKRTDYRKRSFKKIIDDFKSPEDRRHVVLVTTKNGLVGLDVPEVTDLYWFRRLTKEDEALQGAARSCRAVVGKPEPRYFDGADNYEILEAAFATYGSPVVVGGGRWKPVPVKDDEPDVEEESGEEENDEDKKKKKASPSKEKARDEIVKQANFVVSKEKFDFSYLNKARANKRRASKSPEEKPTPKRQRRVELKRGRVGQRGQKLDFSNL